MSGVAGDDVARFRHLMRDWFSVNRTVFDSNPKFFEVDVSNETIMTSEEALMQNRIDDFIEIYNFPTKDAFRAIAARIAVTSVRHLYIDFPRVKILMDAIKKPLDLTSFITTRIKVTNADAPRFCCVCWGKCMRWCYQRENEPLHAMHVICRLYVDSQMLGECVCAATRNQRGLCGWMLGDVTAIDEERSKQRLRRLSLQ